MSDRCVSRVAPVAHRPYICLHGGAAPVAVLRTALWLCGLRVRLRAAAASPHAHAPWPTALVPRGGARAG
eukprot:3717760-Prymnesium_polylepis.1